VDWSVALITDENLFLAQVNRLKRISYIISLFFISAVSIGVFFVERLRLRRERMFSQRLHEAQENERLRISREIHDDIGQNLTAIKIHLSHAQNLDPAVLFAKVEEAKEMIEETNHALRRISHELHPSLLGNLGLQEALRWKVQNLAGVAEFQCHFAGEPDARIEQLPLSIKGHVFRMIQESLNNVQKHSRCSEVHIRLERKGDDLWFSVSDNGIGFDSLKPKNSLGLKSIEERAKLIGGDLRLESQLGRGTTLSCRISLSRREGADCGT
jgi:signal transduction histidine kinase